MRWWSFTLGLAALFIATLISRPAAAAPPSWHITGQVGGPTSAVAIHGNLAYVGVGFRLMVYDVSNPAVPLLVGESAPFPDFVTGVATDGALAYVTAGRAGVRILDTTNPARPSEVGSWDSPGNAEGIAAGTIAYVADGPLGLRALDVSDPCRPVALGSAFETRFAFGVAIQGGHAFVAGAGAGLLVADVRDPAHLVEVAMLDTAGFTRGVVTGGTAAYLADQWGGVRIVSIADPARPIEIGSFALPSWAFGVALSGSTLFVADGSQGLRALDVSDPGNPREVGAYAITWQHAGAVTVSDGTAYVAVRGEGFHAVDVRNPAAPRRLAVASQLAEARAAVAVGDLAYVAAADQGLRVVDLAEGMREIGAVESGDFAYCVATMGPGTLVVGSTGIGSSGVYFFDLSDPLTPRVRSVLAGPGISPTDISVQGSLVAISGEPGIHLIDASDPAAPAVLSFLDITASNPLADLVLDVALAGRTALVAQAGSGLRLVDITDPRNPRIVGTYKPETLVFAQAVAAGGRYAYVLGGPSGLHVVDISDPRAPTTLAVLRGVGGERMRLAGTTLLIAGGAAGLITVDVTDPAKPTTTDSERLPGYAFGVAEAGERVLVLSGDAGLFVLQPDPLHANAPGSRVPWTAGDGAVVEPTDARSPAGPVRLLASREEAATRVAKLRADAASAAARGPAAPAVATARALVVRSAADSGLGTLRDALAGLQAGDTVTFDPAVFPPGAPATIRVSQPLPCLCKDGVTLDASNAGVVIDGSGAPPGSMGLVLTANENRIMGLQIFRFDHSGIWVQGSRNVIGGDRSLGAGPSGQGNIVSGNSFSGINFPDSVASGNRIVGNLIGTDATGTRPLGQQQKGVFLFPGGPGNTVGGTEPWEANVISGNAGAEVFLQQARADTIAGNLIGTDPTGTKRVGSAGMGLGTGGHSSDHVIAGNVIVASQQAIVISDSGSFYNQIVGNRIGIGRDGRPISQVNAGIITGVAVSQSYNRVADNVISGNTQWGITFGFWGSHDSVVTGNLIGTDPTGKEACPNGRANLGGGISLYTLRHGFLGGATPAERNVIAGNEGNGITLSGPGTGGNFILGNLVGTDASGQLPLGNAWSGVEISESDGNFVQGNVLAWNGRYGISISDSTGDRVRRNSVHSNANGGIGLGQRADLLPAAPSTSSVTQTRVGGSACAGCTVEVFSDGGGQGRVFEGEAVAGPDGSFQLSKGAGSLSGPNVTATATDADRSTSAFSGPAVLPIRPGVARLYLGTAEGAPGGSAVVSLSYEAGSTPVSALELEVTAAPPLVYSAASAGAAAALAGKQIFTDPIPGGARIRVEGATPDLIGDGLVTSVTFAIASGVVPGTYGVAAANASARAADGSSVSTLASPGSVAVRPGPAPLGTWTLPSSARVPGAGAFWTTDLTLRNPGDSAATATLRFLGHTGSSQVVRAIGLAGGETRMYRDVLHALFGLINDYGPILVTSAADALVVQGQTWTPSDGGTGTFGQSVPAVATGDQIGSTPRSIVGVREDSSFRTNLMLANPSETPIEVDVSLVNAEGGVLASRRVPMGALSFAQLNAANDLEASGVSEASFVLSTPTPGGRFAAYAAAIDRATGDPRTLLPGSLTTERTWILPSSAHVQGAGAFWTTDLALRNTGSAGATVTIVFLGHTGDGRSGPEDTVSIAAAETRTYRDVLSTLFGRTSDYGPILVRSTTETLAVAGQTWTPGAGGTFGQSVPAIPTSELIGSTPRSIVAVREDLSFRTNLMLANGSESPIDVEVALVASSGTVLASRSVPVGPLSFAQLGVAKDLGISGVADASLVLSTRTPGGRFAAYASVIDQTTGDPRTLLPR